jgi:uncharacterized damage-inducible protein DinB
MTENAKPGRPRRYDISPVIGFANPGAAYAAAMLDELLERLLDLIADLAEPTLEYVPPGATNSIAMLVIHMAWAEASWIATATGIEIPADLAQRLQPGKQGPSGDLASASATVDRLTSLCYDVRQQVTRPALAAVSDIDRQVPDQDRTMTVRGVLMHLVWHWTYHSGQVGLLRRLWGETRYKWTFDTPMGIPHESERPT